ncbi:MAG TPA: TadG family pilus assembly protein [Phycisphaerae bacterium]|nr:TadG family pilus assembly protein [Phycisphaerae bacterium]
MKRNRFRHSSALRRATIITQSVIFGSMVGVGVAAMAVDTGLMYSAKAELQSAADAAALAAASQLGSSSNSTQAAMQEAATFAAANKVTGGTQHMNNNDIVMGHATFDAQTGAYTFNAGVQPYDSVRVTLRRDQTVSDGPVSLVFGRVLGVSGAQMTATATAMVVPRDIDVVVDLSCSMNDDSELRHYKQYTGDEGDTRAGVQVNLKDVWAALPQSKGANGIKNGLNPTAPPSPISGGNSQPGNSSGSPAYTGGNPGAGTDTGANPRGPRWGWMTAFGNPVTLGSYTPVGDPGLYYIPKSSTCSDADVIANLTEAGYSSTERTAILSGANDGSGSYYHNRVMVMLGVAGWKSGKSGGKYTGTGNADAKVDSSELTQTIAFPYSAGSWTGYIDYMTNSSQMRNTDGNFRYRYGLKTLTNYFLEILPGHSSCPDLANAPEMPVGSVKDAVQKLVDTIVDIQTQDHMALEVFATTGHHEVDLKSPAQGQTLAQVLQVVPDTLRLRQAGYYDCTTNAGIGLDKAITELSSSRARTTAAKVIMFLSDGKPNVDQYGNSVATGSPAAVNWAIDRATYASQHGMTIYTIGVGGDANDGFLQQVAEIGHGEYFFADNTPDPQTGQPLYVAQLQQIFQTLGGKRPVRLIH